MATKKTPAKKRAAAGGGAKRKRASTSRGARAARESKFVELVSRGDRTHAQAAREAGYTQHPGGSQSVASRLLSREDIRARVEARRAEALQRARVETDEIIGQIAEIATASIGDVLEVDGSFDFNACVARGTDHLIKKMKRTERFVGVERVVTHELEMYDRLNALNQLRDTFGMKEEPRPNSLGERRRREVEASLERIMARDGVDRQTAARSLLESLKAIPNTEEAIKVVSEYAD